MFDTVQLAKTVMSPRPDGPRTGHSEKGLAAMAAQEPATDAEAGELTLPSLGLLPTDMARIKDLAVAVTEARAALTEAEAALASATREAGKLGSLRSQAGEIAARAYSMNGKGVKMASDITDQIEVASNAKAALPTLERCKAQAADRLAELKGGLRKEAVAALRAAMRRAADRYAMLALEVTRAVAGLEAAYRALPAAVQEPISGSWDIGFIPHVCLPSAGFASPDPAAVEMNYRSVVLRQDHPRLVTHVSAAKGNLYMQLQDAVAPSGIAVSTLLA